MTADPHATAAPQGRGRARRRWLRRGPLENVAIGIIAAGVLMMLQPFWIVLYTWSFLTTLAGTVAFTIVSKFPD